MFFTPEELENGVISGNLKIFTLRVSDKFGDYGLVGVIILNGYNNFFNLENYILSCRILGRRIEFDFLDKVNVILSEKYSAKIKEIKFKETLKNVPAQNFYKQISNTI
jgi:predicted enzyme involved in methoxymalonyl-ACP biosynthesis